jgi:RNA-binding protein
MPNQLTNAQLRKLKALAQHLEPIVRVGKSGVSEAFLQSLDEALANHELVKVKFADFKEEKKTLAPLIAQKSSSVLVTRLGNVVVLYREHPDQERRRIKP